MPRRCALGCTPSKGVLHVFPNPNKFPEQFKAWVQVVSGQDKRDFDYTKLRICDRYFTERDRNRNNRLNALAVPTLFLHDNPVPKPCTSPSSRPKMDHLGTFNVEESFSGTFPKVSQDPLLEHNYCKPCKKTHAVRKWKKNLISAEISKKQVTYQRNIKNVRRLINRLRKRGKDVKSRLENAENLFQKSDFQKVIKDMAPAAKIFTNMQYYQMGKKSKGRRFKLENKVLALSLYKRSPKCYSLMSKYFVLPSTKSLKRLLAQIKLNAGISKIIFEKLKKTVSNLDTEVRPKSIVNIYPEI